MDVHNDPIDYAVAVTDDRVRRLLRERSPAGSGPGTQRPDPASRG